MKRFLKNHFENLFLSDIFFLLNLQVNLDDALFGLVFLFYISNCNQNSPTSIPPIEEPDKSSEELSVDVAPRFIAKLTILPIIKLTPTQNNKPFIIYKKIEKTSISSSYYPKDKHKIA
jgi:hypothetical protein